MRSFFRFSWKIFRKLCFMDFYVEFRTILLHLSLIDDFWCFWIGGLCNCFDSYEVTRTGNTITVHIPSQQIFRIQVSSKDTSSFQRWDCLKTWKMQWGWNTMQYEQNQICWMWIRWTMICKMNEKWEIVFFSPAIILSNYCLLNKKVIKII